ncbi:SDR family NAD(P)-dependent oxidoreductase [Gordonia sp. CPCC 205333]|uniref:SDR family NAD(P)-dependent oxidoreductase n=1 Tax=Gordonia sp. CPCC 205333 TaxID=3140790 RepID=UPI003AF3D335
MKTAIVTGAASGIGMGYATVLAERGFYVLVTDVDQIGAERVAADLNSRGAGQAEARKLDVTDASAVAQVVNDVKRAHGRLDMIFNNAGIGIGGPTDELEVAHWQKAGDVMIMGVAYGVDAAYRIMVEQGFGHIVNTASMAGMVPLAYMAPYNMAKHAVVGMSLSLRGEAAAHGVKVTCVCPIAVNTNIVRNLNSGLGETDETRIASKGYDLLKPIADHVPEFIVASPVGHARAVLKGCDRNRALVIKPWFGRQAWWMQRAFPLLTVRVSSIYTRLAMIFRKPAVSLGKAVLRVPDQEKEIAQ